MKIIHEPTLSACLAALTACEYACRFASDACAADAKADLLGPCIRANRDCVDACVAAHAQLAVPGALEAASAQLQACRRACLECASECAAHADDLPECGVAAAAARACAAACERVQSLGSPAKSA